MITQQTALLKAVIANPRDNLPRLVYADWLEENGQEDYARFIRLQCATDSTSKDQRLAFLTHGEKWAEYCLPGNTTSGDFGAFDKLEGQKYGMICRIPGDVGRVNYPRSYVFDISDYDYWKANTIDWSVRYNTAHYRQDKSGVAFTNGFPTHWRGKVIDWFEGVGRKTVVNYPIERVEFCDVVEDFRGEYRFIQPLHMRFQTLCHSRKVNRVEIDLIQDQLSNLSIEAVK